MKLTKLFSLLLILCLLLIPGLAREAEAAEIVADGVLVGARDGQLVELHWSLDADGHLTLTGSGDMPECQMWSNIPWSSYADDIKTASVSDGVTNIGPFAFYGCWQLTEVDIPDGVTRIDGHAFEGCTHLKSVTLPDSVLSVGSESFYRCQRLETLDLGDGIQLIGKNAFDGCFALKEVTIPASVVHIDSYAFRSCGLETITFAGDPPAFSGMVFQGVGIFPAEPATVNCPQGNDKWNQELLNTLGGDLKLAASGGAEEEETAIGGKCGPDLTWTLEEQTGLLTISGTGDMNNVSSWIYSPWNGYADSITKVVIEEGAASVGDHMLGGLPNLAEVTLPDSLEHIGKGAFEMAASLKEITFPEALESIHANAFFGCASLTEVTVPAGVHVENRVFRDCTGLKKATVEPGTMATLGTGGYLFEGCTALTEVILEDGVTFLPQYMFTGCTALRSITIPDGVEVIAANVFAGCTSLSEVKFAGSVGTLGPSVFENCLSLSAITLPAKLGQMEEAVFRYCENLDTILFPGSAPVIDGSAFATLKVTCYYPAGNPSWNSSTLRYYGSTLIDWIPMAHVHAYTTETTAPTCTVQGYTVYSCDCGYAFVDDFVDAAGHTKKTLPAVEPTCTRDGMTEGEICTVCQEILQQQTVVPAPGHDWQEQSISAEATYTTPGTRELGCTGCGETRQETYYLRLYGSTRFETAYRAADAMKENLGIDKFQAVIVASGTNFADALSGSYLAAVKQAPILLSHTSEKVNEQVKEYIRANLVPGGTVYILGGTAAVPAAMDAGLDEFYVNRLAGATRFDTNLLILEEAGVGQKDILICTAFSFADSLSASAAQRPILLVGDSLNAAQRSFLEELSGNQTYVIGGTSAVSEELKTQVEAICGQSIRLGGNNRFETSVLIAREFFPQPESVVLAYALNFPDGLCGGALASTVGAPLLLTMDGGEAAAADYARQSGISAGALLGGPGLIADETAANIFR